MALQNAVSVLIVEDELIVALNLSKELENFGFNICGMASSEDEAVELAKNQKPDVILMDINLENGGSGLSAAQSIRGFSKVPIIYVTAYSSDKVIQLVGNTNPYGYILKPSNIREVKAVINTSLVRFNYEAQIKKSEQQLKVALEAAELGVIEYNHQDSEISINDHAEAFAKFGFEKNMSKSAFLSLFAKKDADSLEQLLLLGKPFSKRAKLAANNQLSAFFIDVYLSQVVYEDNKVQIGAVQDVSLAQQNVEELKVSDSVLNQMQESVVVLDENEYIRQVNPAFCRLIGCEAKELLNTSIENYLLHDRNEDSSPLALGQGAERYQREVTVKCKNGMLVFAIMTISDLVLSDETKQAVLTLTDVSKLVEAERNLRKIAFTDTLTGFGNRAYLNKLLSGLDDKEKSASIALLFIDIDSFKSINDTLGHEAGDAVLVEFSERLKLVFRDKDYLVRLGGDEFIVILEGNFDKQSLSLIGKKVMQLFEAEFNIADRSLPISCSLGIAYVDSKDFDPQLLLKQADAAMYQAKKSGKNTFKFYDQAMASKTQYRIFLEQGLKSALRNNEIMIYLQPVVDNKGVIKSAEVLCRWYNKEVGFVSPAEFIPVAEESYLIQTLGLKVIHESMLAKKTVKRGWFCTHCIKH